MKHIKYLYMAFALTTGALITSSCNDFLDRPAEDSYNAGTFYKDDSNVYRASIIYIILLGMTFREVLSRWVK